MKELLFIFLGAMIYEFIFCLLANGRCGYCDECGAEYAVSLITKTHLCN